MTATSELAAAEAVGAAYAAVLDPARWGEATVALAGALGAATGALGLFTGDGRDLSALCPMTDPHWHQVYHRDGLHAHNLIWQAALRAASGTAATERMAVSPDAWRRSVIFNEFVRPQGMDGVLTLTLARGPGATSVMSFGRPAGSDGFGTADLERAAPLARLVAGAVTLAAERNLGSAARTIDLMDEAAALVDASGRVITRNSALEPLLASGAVRIVAGRLDAPGLPGLAAAIARAARRGEWPPAVGDRLTGPRLTARILPWAEPGQAFLLGPPMAIVRLAPASPERADFARMYGLTPREADIARYIGEGMTLPEAAERLGIALSTARTHLGRIFDKTDTRNQTALGLLVARFASVPPRA